MKKFKILFIFLFILIPSMVKADNDNLYSLRCIPNIFIRVELTKGSFEKQVCYIQRASDDRLVFQLNSWSMSDTNLLVTSMEDPLDNINLDTWDYKYIERYAAFGYDYFDNSKNGIWYAATQLLIWQRVNKDANIYFIDYKTGERIDNYDEIIDQIRDFVDSQLVIPSISTSKYQVNIGEKLVLKEKDNDLTNFDISVNNENVHIVKENNELVIKGIKKGISEINLTLIQKSLDDNNSVFYKDHAKRIFLAKGQPTTISYKFDVEITAGNILFDTNSLIENNKLIDLKEISYGIYDEEKNLIEIIKMVADGEITSSDLPYGNYLLKQLSTSDNYKLDDNYYKIKLEGDKTSFIIKLGEIIEPEKDKEENKEEDKDKEQDQDQDKDKEQDKEQDKEEAIVDDQQHKDSDTEGELIEEIIEVPNTLSIKTYKNIIFLLYPAYLIINKRKEYEV